MSQSNFYEVYDLVRATVLAERPLYTWNSEADFEAVVAAATSGALVYVQELEEALEHLQGTVKRQYVGT